eukprot:11027889-Alexandrium_andersonii.AAC.1
MQPLDRHGMSTLEMPRGRILARSEDLDTSLVVLARGDVDLATQNTAPQHGGWDRQRAQGMIERDDLNCRSA